MSKGPFYNQYNLNIKNSLIYNDILLLNEFTPWRQDLEVPRLKLLKSTYGHKPSTLFFQYPDLVGMKKAESRVIIARNVSIAFYKFQEGACVYNTVLETLNYSGLQSTTGSNWSIHFSQTVKVEHLSFLQSFQKLNHFPGTLQLGHKDLLWRNISRMKRNFGTEY